MIAWLAPAAAPGLVLFSALLAVRVGTAVGRRAGVDAEARLWAIVAVGIVAARLGYVWRFHAAYAAQPASVLDVRDGGWSIESGFVATWLFALRSALRRPALKRAIAWATGSGTALWLCGAIGWALVASNAEGADLPPLQLRSLSGRPLDLAALKGKPVVLNLWATWCPPCNREMPLLAQAQADHPELQFVFVEQGEPPEEVARWIGAHGLALRNVALDPQRQAGAALGQRAFPTTYFFDARGKLAGDRIGELSLATLTDHLQHVAALSR